jgi:hypothetical protein
MRKFGSLLTWVGLASIVIGLAIFAFVYFSVLQAYIFEVALVSQEAVGAAAIAAPVMIGIGVVLLLLGVVIALGSRKPREGDP